MNEQRTRRGNVLKATLVGIISVLIGSIAFATGYQAEKGGK